MFSLQYYDNSCDRKDVLYIAELWQRKNILLQNIMEHFFNLPQKC